MPPPARAASAPALTRGPSAPCGGPQGRAPVDAQREDRASLGGAQRTEATRGSAPVGTLDAQSCVLLAHTALLVRCPRQVAWQEKASRTVAPGRAEAGLITQSKSCKIRRRTVRARPRTAVYLHDSDCMMESAGRMPSHLGGSAPPAEALRLLRRASDAPPSQRPPCARKAAPCRRGTASRAPGKRIAHARVTLASRSQSGCARSAKVPAQSRHNRSFLPFIRDSAGAFADLRRGGIYSFAF